MKYYPSHKKLHDALREMVYQFAFKVDDPLRLTTGGMSALEHAFRVLGWPNPKPIPERKCQYGRCHAVATCGTPTKKGYKRVCRKHFDILNNWDNFKTILGITSQMVEKTS